MKELNKLVEERKKFEKVNEKLKVIEVNACFKSFVRANVIYVMFLHYFSIKTTYMNVWLTFKNVYANYIYIMFLDLFSIKTNYKYD